MKLIRKNGRVYGIKFGSDNEIFLFDDVVIERLILNVNTGDIKAELSFDFAGDKKLVSVSRSTYQTKKGLLPLQDKGLGVTEENAKYMVQYLKDQERNIKIENVHNRLGYDSEKKTFRIYESIPRLSIYDGELDLKPRGSYKNWLEMYDKYVKGRKELEFIILIALSSAIVGIIGRKIGIDNPIVHIHNGSSCGKTTSIQLAISAWANPSLSVNGLMQTFNETQNSIMHNLNYNNGIIRCFDEISMSAIEDFTSFIYSVSSGKEKGRLSNEVGKGFVKLEQATWNTVVMFTGEHDILEKAKENDGLKVRVYSIGDVKWTENKEMAEAISEVTFENHGYLGELFVKKLMDIGETELFDRYKNSYESIDNFFRKKNIYDEFIHRRSKYYAILILVHSVLTKELGFDMKLSGIATMIKKIEEESIINRNVGKIAYNKFLEEIASHRRRFPLIESKRKRGINSKDDVWGYVLKKDGQVEIFPNEFRKICIMLGFQSPNIILKKWKEKGLLDYESDRNHRERNGANVYVINVSEEFIQSINAVGAEINEEFQVLF